MAHRRRAKFVPGGVGAGGVHETRQPDLKGEFDEWLALVVCFAFSVSPQALRKMMNRASSETQKDLTEEEGLEPTLLWIKAWIDDINERATKAVNDKLAPAISDVSEHDAQDAQGHDRGRAREQYRPRRDRR